MFKATKIFRLWGIDVQLHYSWWFIFVLLSWSLSTSFFPQFFPNYTSATYWFMGILAALFLFISVVLHELSHSLVAKAKKIDVKTITLFFFGGVAGLEKEDLPPAAEFQMALAGPLFSFLLAALFFFVYKFNIHGIVTAISFYLYQLNLVLAIFNLIPGFPLDGGRAFRAILFAYYKDLRKATHIASRVGRFFALILILLGFFGLFNGAGNGLWFILIGGFLYFIAGMSYEQVVLKEVLGKISITRMIKTKYSLLKPDLKLSFILAKYPDETSFIVKDHHFCGILDLSRIDAMPLTLQDIVTLKQIAIPLNTIKPLHPSDTLYTAFQLFAEQNLQHLPVLQQGKLMGILSRTTVENSMLRALKFGSQTPLKKRFLHKHF